MRIQTNAIYQAGEALIWSGRMASKMDSAKAATVNLKTMLIIDSKAVVISIHSTIKENCLTGCFLETIRLLRLVKKYDWFKYEEYKFSNKTASSFLSQVHIISFNVFCLAKHTALENILPFFLNPSE